MLLQTDPFPLIQIFVPVVAFLIAILCCVSLCKTIQRVRRGHLESQTRTLDTVERPSVYVIPISPAEDQLHGPPRYSTVNHYGPPPSYHELELKPDFNPHGPPPSYSESSFSPPDELSASRPAQTHTLVITAAL